MTRIRNAVEKTSELSPKIASRVEAPSFKSGEETRQQANFLAIIGDKITLWNKL